jgi:hypothetical protein
VPANYEIAVHVRTIKDPLLSITTFSSHEEAEAAAEPITKGERVPWLKVDEKDILAVHVREADGCRPSPDGESLAGLLNDLERVAPGSVTGGEGG